MIKIITTLLMYFSIECYIKLLTNFEQYHYHSNLQPEYRWMDTFSCILIFKYVSLTCLERLIPAV